MGDVDAFPVMDAPKIDSLSYIFAPKITKELGSYGRSPSLARLLRLSGIHERLAQGADVRLCRVFDYAYNILKQPGNRCAYVYKNVLARNRFLGKHSLSTASMLNEFRVGNSRADVVILNGTSTCYEIKSERDSLGRLETQLASYIRVFDKVYVITAEECVRRVTPLLPDSVGLMVVNRRSQVSERRSALSNKATIDTSLLFDSLTLPEIETIFSDLGIPLPTLPNTRIRRGLKQRFVELDPAVAHDAAVTSLLHHRSLQKLATFIEALPDSLTAAGLAFSSSEVPQLRLLDALQADMSAIQSWA